jgi:tRNA-splicing ligase RtcB (3'-phosphate/5'-hydroxy nucleic acid ligase)
VYIKTFGVVDGRSLAQLKRCMEHGDADYGVLCADHHPGYSQPIGGAVAYEGYVSPSGVGFDIGCVAAGEAVLCADGCSRAIEQASDPLCAGADGALRPVAPFLGVVDRGRRDVVRVTLANRRSVVVTPDHQIRTARGWQRADALRTGDRALCSVFVGWPNNGTASDAALLRIAGYLNGDGHVAVRGNRASLYTSKDRDAADLARDLVSLGYSPSIHHRIRPSGSIENAVYASDPSLRERLVALGCPVGRKRGKWRGTSEPILRLPSWARACYLSGFASAEMSTPRLIENRVQSLAIKQRGADAVEQVKLLLESLGFEVGISRSDGENWVAQILGGEEGQLRFIEMVGFCRAADKRLAAASVMAVAWERAAHLAVRTRAQALMRERMAAGQRVRLAAASVAAETGLTEPTLTHLAYRRGVLRRALGWCPIEYSLGECAYSPVVGVEPAGMSRTYDVATADPAESFVANGVIVHNCGNKAVRTDLTLGDLENVGGVATVMREITERISFGMGVPARERVDHPVLEKIRHAPFEPQRRLASLAASQLGTVGSGNHYVNLMEDEAGRVWVGVHFGSRGFGHRTASGFLALAQGLAFEGHAQEGGMDAPPVLLEVGSELGDSYIAAMKLAGEYAYAGRDVVVAKVLEILSAEAVYEVHNHHNFAFSEEHLGRTYWVIRKGCTPARPGQEGFVGGSMGDASVILEGVDSAEAQNSLYSTVHGAGRVMSRTEAAGRTRRGKQVKPGKVDWPAVQARLREQGIVLVGGGADEAPEVYKRLPDVLAAHAGSIRVTHTLRPLGVAMAGRDVRDPYRD